ncbi:hypothetical protein [Pseudarthrobacter oxydans]|uniref:hypothetical protein n=1 Tax=Pseudarthrobacter oxydans TaxID=1671 RepID=UPI003800761E
MRRTDFYSDRINGPTPRVHEQLPERTSKGLLSLFINKIEAHWFAERFPEHCEDGNGICGTNGRGVWTDVEAHVPNMAMTGGYYGGSFSYEQADEVTFDLIEYAASRLSKPKNREWHDFMKHHELSFDEAAGRKAFRDEVNTILQRGGTVYELSPQLEIIRIGTPAVQQVLEQLTPASGDDDLDGLLLHAKELFLSRKEANRGLALDKLWDAFTRLKTVDVQGNKLRSISVLLQNIDNEAFREVTNAEMNALTKLGNDFMIRHHETGTHSVPPEAYDYLFARMGSLIVYLLKVSGRLG